MGEKVSEFLEKTEAATKKLKENVGSQKKTHEESMKELKALTELCRDKLPKILRGEVDAADVKKKEGEEAKDKDKDDKDKDKAKEPEKPKEPPKSELSFSTVREMADKMVAKVREQDV